jgi:uncharacterized protein (TIGR00266 family)
MHTTIEHGPSYALAHVQLFCGEQLRIESGAMAAHSAGVELDGKMRGGVLTSLMRGALGGESVFLTTCTAPTAGGWVDLAPVLPGDVFTVDVAESFLLTRGSFLACSPELELTVKLAGLGKFLGGEGGFLVQALGRGTLIGSCFGALRRHQLEPGQTITVDAGHLVGHHPTVTTRLRKATRGILRTLKTGEGFVFDVTGPGELLTQSRNPSEYLDWLDRRISDTSGVTVSVGSR